MNLFGFCLLIFYDVLGLALDRAPVTTLIIIHTILLMSSGIASGRSTVDKADGNVIGHVACTYFAPCNIVFMLASLRMCLASVQWAI